MTEWPVVVSSDTSSSLIGGGKFYMFAFQSGSSQSAP